ncbi:MAG: choice-of-anchor Q domain-containing protein [Fibrobacterota bacterium]
MKPAHQIFFFFAVILSLQCDRQDSSHLLSPLVSLPDTLPALTPPNLDHLPLLTVGDGTVSGCTRQELQKAIDSLSTMKTGGLIRFSTGEEPVTLTLSQPLSITADSLVVIDGGNLVTLDGQSRMRIIECDHYTNLTLANIRLVNGRADSSGGAIMHPWYGTLACYNVTFYNNRCTSTGPEFGGGAIYAGGLTEAIFFGCTFVNNGGSNGGAILNRGTNLRIDSCTFSDNTATGDGGGRDAGANGRGGLGGAVYIDGMNYDYAEPFYLSNSIFTNNSSHCHGSAVFSYYYKNKPGNSGALIEKCGFYSNHDSGTTTSSGALYHEGAPLKLHASSFIENTTVKHAGAVFLGPDSPTEMINCTFYGNTTPGNGGAIFGGRQEILIKNCTFSQNTASYGPAIFNDVPDAVSIFNSLFDNNVPINNQYAYRNCTTTYENGAVVIQWPPLKVNGREDNPCIQDVHFVDPMLQPPSSNGGPTRTMALDAQSPAIGICDACPETDQRGIIRKDRCDAGAFEYSN